MIRVLPILLLLGVALGCSSGEVPAEARNDYQNAGLPPGEKAKTVEDTQR